MRAEAEGFDVFVITDANLRDQHNLAGRTLAVDLAAKGSDVEVNVPFARSAS